MNFELIPNEKYEMELFGMGRAHLATTFPAQPTGPFGLRLKQGSPHSPPARGSPAESDRPAASDRERRCRGGSPGSEGPDLGHRQRRGSLWRARDGEAGQRWGTGDGRSEKRWRASAQGSWSGVELKQRSLRWRSTSVAGGGWCRGGPHDRGR
jgi:hypothetical protein